MKLNHVLAATLYFLLLNCHAQDFALSGDDIEWSEGQVTLTNGVTLKGAVRYNSKSGLLAFDSGSESKVLTPRSVSSFDYYDAIRQNQRKFYSLELEDAKGIVKPQFFEVLKELKTFALISTENPMELKKKQSWDPVYSTFFNTGNNGYVTKTVAAQVEIIYLLDLEGDINPYLILSNEEMPRSFVSDTKTKVKSKVVGEESLKKLTAPHYAELKAYAKKMKLTFGDKEELFRILEHYKQLLSTEVN
jgi:hypothetical protein